MKRRRVSHRPVLADGWFSWLGTTDGEHAWTPLTTAVDHLRPKSTVDRLLRIGFVRGLTLGVLSSRHRVVAVIRYDRGWRTLLLIRALLGRHRKLVVFQFFNHAPADNMAARLWSHIDAWALRRTLLLAQVVTHAELDAYPRIFGIPAERFRLVRFPARSVPRGASPPQPRSNGPLFATGRAFCDWRTLFAAASGSGWDLHVVCSEQDRAQVEALNALTHARAHVRVELPQAETRALLSRAVISILCLTDGLIGRGHIRLMEATDTGTAVIASDVSSLDGYVQNERTAILVPPGDPAALRDAVQSLLDGDDARKQLALEAFAAADGWTGSDYVAVLQELAARAPETLRGARPSRSDLSPKASASHLTRVAQAQIGRIRKACPELDTPAAIGKSRLPICATHSDTVLGLSGLDFAPESAQSDRSLATRTLPLSSDQPLRRAVREVRRLLSSPDAVWKHALPEEVGFWAEYINSGGLTYPDEFRRRLDPHADIDDPLLLNAIDHVGGQEVRILDVGAGPLTSVGFADPREPRRRIHITAIDPLADQYVRLLEKAGLKAPSPTLLCRGEDISQRFKQGQFDIAYARNALDHAVDPLSAIQNMTRVIQPGGVVVLIHNRREAEAQRYEQLHQWNFDVQHDRLVLFNRDTWLDVGRYLGSDVHVESLTFGTAEQSWVSAVITHGPAQPTAKKQDTASE
jgi:SAM-dependent methyltransferase